MLVCVSLQLFFIRMHGVFISLNSFRHNCNITLHISCDVNPGISGMVSKNAPFLCWRVPLSTHGDVTTVIINLGRDKTGNTWPGIWSYKTRKLRVCGVTGTWLFCEMGNKTAIVLYKELCNVDKRREGVLMKWQQTHPRMSDVYWRYWWCWTSDLSLPWWVILFRRGRAVPSRNKVGHCYLALSQTEPMHRFRAVT